MMTSAPNWRAADSLDVPFPVMMTRAPRTVGPDVLAAEALHTMTARERPITSLFVIDAAGFPLGILHVHDLLRAGVA